MFEKAKERISEVIAPALKKYNLEVFDISIKRHGNTIAVILIVDHSEGGIMIDECSHINKLISRFLEEENVLEGDYTVEVSSPGLDRSLKTLMDFKRVRGKKVKFHLTQAIENKLEHDGIIKNTEADAVTVDIKQNTVTIPLILIQKAVQII